MNTSSIHTLAPKGSEAKKLMIMLHGLGSNGEDLISLAPILQMELPDYIFASPDAIEPYDMSAFGRQWFSLANRDAAVITKHVERNMPLIQDLIASIQTEHGFDNKNTILLGFSQGTMVASYLTLHAATPFYAMIGFSGRLILPPQDLNKLNKQTPICLIHGEVDEIVSVQESEKFAKYCQHHNIPHFFQIIPKLKHSIDGNAIETCVKFLLDLKAKKKDKML